MIAICSKRKSRDRILKEYPNCVIADCTSQATDALRKLSPFYPHGNIPVPYTNGLIKANSVESIWQGLKVFEHCGIDTDLFNYKGFEGVKRTVKKNGRILGHMRGPYGRNDMLLNYLDARLNIYIPSYRWMLENCAFDIIERLRSVMDDKTIVLLDYNTNCDIKDLTKPLSHAFLVKAYAEGLPPYEDVKIETIEHHYYSGKRDLHWTTTNSSFKLIESNKEPSIQLEIPFDNYEEEN